jgi:glycine dehydrogenase subunit 2
MYYDGANLNAVMGRTSPGAMDFDTSALQPSQDVATPHGGGGPGAGPSSEKGSGTVPSGARIVREEDRTSWTGPPAVHRQSEVVLRQLLRSMRAYAKS